MRTTLLNSTGLRLRALGPKAAAATSKQEVVAPRPPEAVMVVHTLLAMGALQRP